MNFFKQFYIPPNKDESSGNCFSNNGDSTVDSVPFNRIYLSPDLFTDASSASEYVCKICHFMVVDPLEHIPGPNVTCSNVFCLPCVKTYSTSGLSSCPAEGCLTTDFDLTSLRELGTREVARLSNLTLNCEFNCAQVITYRDYWTHRKKCPANPENFCDICDAPKISETHNCRETFLQLKERDDNLTKENIQLKAEIDKLRRELDSLRFERAEKIKTGLSNNTTFNGDSSNSKQTLDGNSEIIVTSTIATNGKVQGEKNEYIINKFQKKGLKENQNAKGKEHTYKDLSSDASTSSSLQNDETGFLRGSVPQFKFHSNCFNSKFEHKKIRLIFHYAEKSFKFEDVLPSYTFRTLRSLLTDMMKFDPGIMLLVRHRVLHEKETVSSCGFRPGNNAISIVPLDTPNFNEPGFRLGLYRFKCANDPLDARNTSHGKMLTGHRSHNDPSFMTKEIIDFYSNSLEPELSDEESEISLTFRPNGKYYTVRVKRAQTIDSIRSMVDYLIDSKNMSTGKMMYITHQLIKDDMTVKQCGIGSGTVDITLLPSIFPVDLEKTQNLHLIRFRNRKTASKMSKKLKSRASSMASLV